MTFYFNKTTLTGLTEIKKQLNNILENKLKAIEELNKLTQNIVEVKREGEYSEEFEQKVREIVDELHRIKILNPNIEFLKKKRLPGKMNYDWSYYMSESDTLDQLHEKLNKTEKIVLETLANLKIELRKKVTKTITPELPIDSGPFSTKSKDKKIIEKKIDTKIEQNDKNTMNNSQSTSKDEEKKYFEINFKFVKFKATERDFLMILFGIIIGLIIGIPIK